MGTSDPVTTAGPGEPTEGSGDGVSESGNLGTCAEPPPGMEMVVRPADIAPAALCGLADTSTGVLQFVNNQYVFNRAVDCVVGDSVPVVFSPKGPKWGNDMSVCVTFELRYRPAPDCTFDSAVIRDAVSQQLIYAAATSADSPIVEVTVALGEPLGDVCDCETAQCCANAPAPGLYLLDIVTLGGDVPDDVGQADQTTFMLGAHPYELGVEQARAIDRCEDPLQVDWYVRQDMGG